MHEIRKKVATVSRFLVMAWRALLPGHKSYINPKLCFFVLQRCRISYLLCIMCTSLSAGGSAAVQRQYQALNANGKLLQDLSWSGYPMVRVTVGVGGGRGGEGLVCGAVCGCVCVA